MMQRSLFNNLNIKKSTYNLEKELDNSWSHILSELLDSDYAKHLTNFIEQIYLSGEEIYPKKEKLFQSLKQCSLNDVKVVIIDDRPVKDIRSSGIGRGIIEPSYLIKDLPIELREFRDCIYETIYGNQYSITNFDNSLDNYPDEGMLFINSSLCVGKDKDYSIIWRNFIRNIIQKINEANTNVVYLFLTNNNGDLYEFIDESKNKIIVNPDTKLKSDSNIFIEVDEYIEKNYPKSSKIIW